MFYTLAAGAEESPRKAVPLNADWKFHKGEVVNGQAPGLDDSGWSKVRVPHDWAVREHFDMTIDLQYSQVVEDGDTVAILRTGRTGALPAFGVGCYRRNISLPASDNKKQVWIEFDGAMSNATVFLNGNPVGEWAYGYSSFSLDMTRWFRFGENNVLAVRLNNKEGSSRWYSGAGIFRNVRLVVRDAVSVAHWGTYIITPEVSPKKATAVLAIKIDNAGAASAPVTVMTDIVSADGKTVANARTTQTIASGGGELKQTFKVAGPRLWDIDDPTMYRAVTKIYAGKTLLDSYETPFGFRTIRFDRDEGFFLNGRHVKLKGVCLHHDLGPLGAAVNTRATERQLEIMKEMGCNAIRTSHNPPSPELLELCDRMGFVVQVESFDEWTKPKGTNGYAFIFDKWYERDMTSMIHRDRNHPSVIMWSIGNEVREQRDANGYLIARKLAEICSREDPTRPVTAGFDNHHGAVKNGLAAEVDLVGFNYKPADYRTYHQSHPQYVIYGSETSSAVSSRGVYKFPVERNKRVWHEDYQLSSYDLESVPWGFTPDEEFFSQEDKFVLGEFVWTGFDYLGEPSPYNPGTPARSSYFGIVDLAGLKKDRFYLYQSRWSDKPMLHVLPHWTFPGREGMNTPVFCYTNYPKAELFVNGKSMGVREFTDSSVYSRYRLMWNNVTYQPGEIKVVAYDKDGKPMAEEVVKTTGKPQSIRMTADRGTIKADGQDLSFVTVEVVDENGLACPTAANYLFFEAKGAGGIRALCNGDPTDHTPFSSSSMALFSGKLVVVLEAGTEPGEIELKSLGGKLQPATLTVKVR